ncbi:hypothetical protein [Idiomarina xiamenensis]|uniref:hypothetical protein n=1 Tax=Idiomarina xiamenensis TaxID=1207041 RepID=UPI0012EAF8BE|nr:hypothetical protein [Idiomarina xiamenensis]
MGKTLLISSILGATIPLVWLIVWNLAKTYCEQCTSWLMGTQFLDFTLLTLWPSSILLIGDSTDSNFQLQTVSLIINVLFYMIIGLASWLAFSKSLFYFIPVVCFYFWWYWFIT